jgi:signal transduction histidine kinase
MQLAAQHVTARQRWLDAALIVGLAATSLLWNDALLMVGVPDNKTWDPPFDKVTSAFGSVDAWHTYVAGWWLASLPAAIGIVLRHRRPLTALVYAVATAALHLFDGVMQWSPIDAVVLITMAALTGSAHPRRRVIAVLIGAEAFLFTGCLVLEMHVLTVVGGRAKASGTVVERLSKSIYPILHGEAMPLLLNAVKAAVVPALLLAATWAVADSARTRRAHLATLQARADDLEREQRQRTALAVAAERGRITRELHDVVAHGLSVIVVQAQGAKAMLTRQPERTEAALTNIVTIGRASLAEMRRLLGLVQTEPHAELAPQPSLAALPELIDRVRNSGTEVDFRVTGEPVTLPAVIELAAYRIVQEALTNVLKHATPGAGCAVMLDFGPTGLGIRVTDNGEPVPPPPPGNGLRGIAERVHALGGELRAGPAAAGGFEVSALLPPGAGEPVPPAATDPTLEFVS